MRHPEAPALSPAGRGISRGTSSHSLSTLLFYASRRITICTICRSGDDLRERRAQRYCLSICCTAGSQLPVGFSWHLPGKSHRLGGDCKRRHRGSGVTSILDSCYYLLRFVFRGFTLEEQNSVHSSFLGAQHTVFSIRLPLSRAFCIPVVALPTGLIRKFLAGS